MFFYQLLRLSFVRRFIRWSQFGRTKAIMADISPSLKEGDRVVDIGSGGCSVADALMGRGFSVTAVDVRDSSCVPNIKPVLYDGKHLPFADKSFDVALSITVLHHTPDPDQVLREAGRVAKRVMIQEDVFRSTWQRYATYVMDSVLNLEFFGHPHTNKSESEWKQTFKQLGFSEVSGRVRRFWKLFLSVTYVMRSPD
ncbi:class I SAM-dependent methyltransferase [Patescibacteria group bacterium]|nr:class I SAM-dependent methyltransferase [Patescibacteria group bacterium]